MSPRNTLWAVWFSLSIAVGMVGEAAAQDSRATTVTGRSRPGTDAIGVRYGSFFIYPSVTLGSEYNSNIFATDGNEDDDVILTISPEIAVQSDWGQHALEFQGSATIFRYADNTSEDVEDYSFATNGRVDILRDTFVSAGFGIQRDHEERGSPDDVNGEEPAEFTTIGGQLQFSHRINRLSTQLGGFARHLDFDDVDTPVGSINNDDRDRMEYETSLRVGYDFHPDAAAFVQAKINFSDYDETPDDAGFNRDSHGYEVVGGISFNITNLIFGEFFAGVLAEEFDDPAFDSTLGYLVGANIAWNVTPLTTINLEAGRSFEETTVVGASSSLTTDAAISVDHELLRNLLLDAGFSYKLQEFEGTSRNDDTIVADVGAAYLMSRFVHVLLGYSYTQRFSDAPGQDYSEHAAKLRVRIQY